MMRQYHILIQLLAWVAIAPYMSMSRWNDDFHPPQLYKNVSPIWSVHLILFGPVPIDFVSVVQVLCLPGRVRVYEHRDLP